MHSFVLKLANKHLQHTYWSQTLSSFRQDVQILVHNVFVSTVSIVNIVSVQFGPSLVRNSFYVHIMFAEVSFGCSDWSRMIQSTSHV